jgi:hypothetical protein
MDEYIVYKRKNCGIDADKISDSDLEFVGKYSKMNDYEKDIRTCVDKDIVFIVKKYSLAKFGFVYHSKYTFKEHSQKFTKTQFVTMDEQNLPANKKNSQAKTMNMQKSKK